MDRPFLRRTYFVIDRVRTVTLIAIFAFIMTVGAVQIFMRYTPGINAMSWVDEIMRYLNIWVVLLASSIGVKYGTHLKMDYLLAKWTSGKGVKAVRFTTELAVIIALAVLIYYGVVRTYDNRHTVIQSLPISIAWFYAAIPIGSALMLLEFLLIFLNGRHPYVQAKACADIANI
jgi:TRAP-type C4-dicarboxylate transport system permease small subunit